MNKLDLKKFENKFGMGSILPLVYKINELVEGFSEPVVESTTELIKLGIAKVSHTSGTAYNEVGTCETLSVPLASYIPIKDMKINKVIFMTSLTASEITSNNMGTLSLIERQLNDLGNLENNSIDITLGLPNANSSYGFDDNRLIYQKINTNSLSLKAFTSEYKIGINLFSTIPTGEYIFEVYLEVEYL